MAVVLERTSTNPVICPKFPAHILRFPRRITVLATKVLPIFKKQFFLILSIFRKKFFKMLMHTEIVIGKIAQFYLLFAELNTTSYIQQLESRIKLLEDEKQLLLTKIKLNDDPPPPNPADRRWKSNVMRIMIIPTLLPGQGNVKPCPH